MRRRRIKLTSKRKDYIVNNEIPVVIVHIGYKDYLRVNLEITSRRNKIYLIGDDSLRELDRIENVTFVNIDKYRYHKKVKELEKSFKNYSNYDRDWIWQAGNMRVFVIKMFLEEYKFDRIFNIDSDNILLKNIDIFKTNNDISYHLNKNYDNPMRMSSAIHNGFLNIDYCERYEKLYKDIYVTETKLDLIRKKIEYHKKGEPGGICEMTLNYLLSIEYDDIDDLGESKNGMVFINNYNNGEGWKSKNQYSLDNNGKIKIFKKGEKNMIYEKLGGEYLELLNVHFQGDAKKYLNMSWIIKNLIV